MVDRYFVVFYSDVDSGLGDKFVGWCVLFLILVFLVVIWFMMKFMFFILFVLMVEEVVVYY